MNFKGTAARLNAALMRRDPIRALETLRQEGTINEIPEVHRLVGFGDDQSHKDLWRHTKIVVSQVERRVDLRWAALFHDVGKPVVFRNDRSKVTFHLHEAVSRDLFLHAAARMGLSPEFASHVAGLIEGLGHVESYSDNWTVSAIRRLRRELGPVSLNDVILLSKADITTKHDNKRRAHWARMDRLLARADAILHEDSRPAELPKGLGLVISDKLGVNPGPELGAVMNRLRREVREGNLPVQAGFDIYVNFLRES